MRFCLDAGLQLCTRRLQSEHKQYAAKAHLSIRATKVKVWKIFGQTSVVPEDARLQESPVPRFQRRPALQA